MRANNPIATTTATNRIVSSGHARRTAIDAVEKLGCTGMSPSEPRQTRGTWIVRVRTDEGIWRVHIDPRNGTTRPVQIEG